jgi:hypothetical protein
MSLYASWFDRDLTAAFGNMKLQSGVASAVAFFTLSSFSIHAIAKVCLAVNGFAIAGYWIAHCLHSRRSFAPEVGGKIQTPELKAALVRTPFLLHAHLKGAQKLGSAPNREGLDKGGDIGRQEGVVKLRAGVENSCGHETQEEKRQRIKAALVTFYAHRDRTRVAHVDVVMERYKGQEHEILLVIAKAEKEEQARGSVHRVVAQQQQRIRSAKADGDVSVPPVTTRPVHSVRPGAVGAGAVGAGESGGGDVL